MKFKVVASGSKGNCTVVLCDNTNLIIDMGISYLTLKRSLEENFSSESPFSILLSFSIGPIRFKLSSYLLKLFIEKLLHIKFV